MVTAAHCFKPSARNPKPWKKPELYTVKAGDYYNRGEFYTRNNLHVNLINVGRKRVDEECKRQNEEWINPQIDENEKYSIFETDNELEIEKIIMHKDYNHGDPFSPNDIALILLKEAITFGQFQVKKY